MIMSDIHMSMCESHVSMLRDEHVSHVSIGVIEIDNFSCNKF